MMCSSLMKGSKDKNLHHSHSSFTQIARRYQWVERCSLLIWFPILRFYFGSKYTPVLNGALNDAEFNNDCRRVFATWRIRSTPIPALAWFCGLIKEPSPNPNTPLLPLLLTLPTRLSLSRGASWEYQVAILRWQAWNRFFCLAYRILLSFLFL